MRIAVVHSKYSVDAPSGENIAADAQVEALRNAGHRVDVVEAQTDASRRDMTLFTVRAGARVALDRGNSPLRQLAQLKPDIIHVHNLFPNFSRRWVLQTDAPILATLHNYRPLCPAGTFSRGGRRCTLCLDRRNALSAVRYGCYKNHLQSIPLALSTRFQDDPILANATRLLTLSDEMSEYYERAGVPSSRLTVLENFVAEPQVKASRRPHNAKAATGWLYVGRLSEEKGVERLLKDWPMHERLTVIGDGPLGEICYGRRSPSIIFVGRKTRAEIYSYMTHARGLVFPSLAPESLSLSCIEALAHGLPIITWPGIPAARLIAHHRVGWVVQGSIGDVLAAVEPEDPNLRDRCRELFETRYSEASWLARYSKLLVAVS